MDELTRELMVGAVHTFLLIKEHIAQVTGGKRRELDEWIEMACHPDASPKHICEAEEAIAQILFNRGPA